MSKKIEVWVAYLKEKDTVCDDADDNGDNVVSVYPVFKTKEDCEKYIGRFTKILKRFNPRMMSDWEPRQATLTVGVGNEQG